MPNFYPPGEISPERISETGPENCPFCRGDKSALFYWDSFRPYYRCFRCDLVFVPTPWQLNREQEKARYDTHENDPSDRGYRKYLGRIIPPLKASIPRIPGSLNGLDYGCGPGPALAMMLKERGFSMNLYDPFYFNNPQVLKGNYDFITCTEVFEHMKYPGEELPKLLTLLKPKGVLAVMTQLVTDKINFKTWYYCNDETHICYFSRKSFQWAAEKWGLRVDFIGKDIIILHS